MILNCAIIDEDPEALQLLEQYIEKSPTLHLIGAYKIAIDAVDGIHHNHLDILFLAIHMQQISGLEFAKVVPKNVKIVFTTAFKEYAIEAYKVNAFDYLLKPVTYERLAQLLDELSSIRPAATDELVIKTSFGYHALRLSDIEYAEARNKHVVFHLRDGRDIEALESLRSVEDRLAQNTAFFKCHRSYQVNLRNIDHYNRTDIVMRSGACIPLSRSCKQGFQDAYFAVRFEGGRR